MQRVVEPQEKLVRVKMRKYELDNLSYKKEGYLQVRKEGVRFVYFYRTHPSTYETVKHVVCTWSRGYARIPESWVESVQKTGGFTSKDTKSQRQRQKVVSKSGKAAKSCRIGELLCKKVTKKPKITPDGAKK